MDSGRRLFLENLEERVVFAAPVALNDAFTVSEKGVLNIAATPVGAYYNAGSALVANEVPNGSETTSNGVWSYGMRAVPAGTSFIPMSVHTDNFVGNGNLQGWYGGEAAGGGLSFPILVANVSGATISDGNWGPPGGPIPSANMVLHPSPAANPYAVVRFTAPTAGTYRVAPTWTDISTNNTNQPTDGVDVHVVVNGVSVYDGVAISEKSAPTASTVQYLTLAAGATVDFSLGSNGFYGSDGTVFNATIQLAGSGLFTDNGSGRDFDPDNDPISVTGFSATSANGATVTVAADGGFTYNPATSVAAQNLLTGQTLNDTFTYTISDGSSTSTATVSVLVRGVTDTAPVAKNDAFTVSENATLNVAAVANGPVYDLGAAFAANEAPNGTESATNIGGVWSLGKKNTVAGTGFTTLAHHTNALVGNANLQGWMGNQMLDGNGTTLPITVVNVASTAVMEPAFGGAGGPFPVGYLALHPAQVGQADPYSVVRFTAPAAGNYSITPTWNEINGSGNGVDVHILVNGVSIFDGIVTTTLTTAKLAALAAGDKVDFVLGPNGDYGADGTAFNAIIQSSGAGLFADNGSGIDRDADGNTISVSAFSATSAFGATVSVNPNGGFTYNPATSTVAQNLYTGQTLTDSFSYTVTDGTSTSTAVVTVVVNGITDIPTQAKNDNFTITENQSINLVGARPTAVYGAGADLLANERGPGNANQPFETQNPNFYQPKWSYGQRTNTLDTALTLYTAANHENGVNTSFGGAYDGFSDLNGACCGRLPFIWVNYGAPAGNPDGTVGTGDILVHPDGNPSGSYAQEDKAVIRFTPTIAGTYRIDALWEDVDDCCNGVGEGADVHIVKTSGGVPTSVFDDAISRETNDALNTSTTFGGTVTLAVGDVLDFVVGTNSQLAGDSTRFNATVRILGSGLFADNGNGPDLGESATPYTVTSYQGTSALGIPVTITPLGGLSYSPANYAPAQNLAAGQSLTDSFTYTISDGTTSSTATVTVTINGVNDAVDDAYSLNEDNPADGVDLTANDANGSVADTTPASGTFNGLLANDDGAGVKEVLSVQSSQSGGVQTLSGTQGTVDGGNVNILTNQGGRVIVNDDGTFTYDQQGVFNSLLSTQTATDSFTYTFLDSVAHSWNAGADMLANERGPGNVNPATESQNPNFVVPQWSYGQRAVAVSSALQLYIPADHQNSQVNGNLDGFSDQNAQCCGRLPHIYVNTGPAAGMPDGSLATGEILMHPDGFDGDDGGAYTNEEKPVVRFTAPFAGNYSVNAVFEDMNACCTQLGGAGVDVYVIKTVGGVASAVFTSAISREADALPTLANYTGVITLGAGDTLDFVVGTNAQLYGDATRFNALISALETFTSTGTVTFNIQGQADGSLTAALDGGGNLVITDTDAVGKNNDLTIRNDGAGNIVISDPTESFNQPQGIAGISFSNSDRTLTVPIASITGSRIIVNSALGNDRLTVNLANSLGKTLDYNGGGPVSGPGDSLVLTGGTTTTVTHSFTNNSDGSVTLAGAVTGTINYTGLEPISDNLSATNRVFDFSSAASETITFRNSVAVGFDLFLDSSVGGEQIDFVKPTATLTINLPGGGVDTIDLQTSAITGDFSVTGTGADDVVNVTGGVTLTGATAAASISGVQTINFNGGLLTAVTTASLTAGAIATSGAGVDVAATSLIASAVTGIDLDTNVTNLTATTSGAGSINLDEANGANVLNVAATNGDATVTSATGALNVTTVSASGTVALAGAITDANAAANNITGASFLASTVGGIALNTTVGQLAAVNSTSGAILISNTGALNITTLSEPSIGSVSGVTNPAGAVTVIALSPLTVSAPVSASGAVVLTATDSAAAGDNLAINATVTSTGSSVTLNSGDNTSVTANLSAATTVAINIDAGDADPGAGNGASLNIGAAVVISATGAAFTGAGQGDSFSFAPQVSTAINVFGLAPVANPDGDTLTLDTTLATNPTLNILNGQGAGLYTFGNRANVQYSSIENGGATTPYHISLDSTATGIDNIRLQRSNEAAIGANFEVYNSNTNDLLYGGLITNVLSFTFLGSANANTVTVDDANGLVDLAGTVPAPSGVGNNTNVAGTPEVFLRGNGGADSIVFANTQNNTDQIYGFGTGAAAGSQAGEVRTTNGPRVLSLYFDGVEGVVSNDATPGDTGTLTIVGDANPNTISLASSAGGTTVSATGYVPFTFAPQSFNAAIVNGGDGNDAITLQSLNAAEATLTLALNGEIGNDTISVESAPAGGTLALQGGVGNDAYQLGGSANTVDSIFIPITIADTSGTDSLTLNDSADLSGDTVTITDSTIDGVNGAPSPNVSFTAIEALDVTTSGGDDSISTTLNGTNGLITANIRGAGGDDDFFLSTADNMTVLTTINLIGEAGSDDFGNAIAPIHPLASTTTNLAVYGDTTAITTNPGGAVTDHLFLDMTTTSAGLATQPLVIVDTVTGQATTANTRLFRFGGIDDIDFYDGGVLTDVAIGDLYLRATEGADNLIFYRENGGVFVKRNGLPVSATPYAPTNRIVAYGRAGNDYMEFNSTLGSTLSADFRGGNDNDTLVGGLGSDLLVGGAGSDTLRGGEGADVLYGEDQFLTTSPIAFNVQRATGVVLSAGGGNDTLEGGGGNDFLFGGTGDDNLNGGLGNDYVHGGDGIDTLNSGGGNDILRGEAGDDLINGDAGNDIILGGAGADRIFGRGGRDFMLAGSGADQIQDEESSSDVVVAGGLLQDNDNSFVSGGTLTGLNDYDLALQALMFTGPNAWNGAASFATRVSNLTSLTAIINDNAVDQILGNVAGQDYIISNANDARLNTTGDQLLTV